MNVITVSGNVGKDVEMKYFDSGSVVASFPLGVTIYDYKKKEYKTLWFKCQVWGKKAEFVGEYIKKGDRVILSGSFFVEEYTNTENKKFSKNCISVNEIERLNKKDGESGATHTKPEHDNSGSEEALVEFGDAELSF